MSLSEALERHLTSEEVLKRRSKLINLEDYIHKLPRLEVNGETSLSDIFQSIPDLLQEADITRGQRAGLRRLIGEIDLVHDSEGTYHVTVGDIRRMTDEELMLLGGGPSGFHPGLKSVIILRALFGREETTRLP